MASPIGVAGGLVVALVGGLLAQYARAISTFQERLDAIGSTTPIEEVEAAEWKVLLNRVLGTCLLVVGVLFALFALAG